MQSLNFEREVLMFMFCSLVYEKYELNFGWSTTTVFLLLMPKNKGRGGKNYKRGKHSGPIKRELLTKEED